MYVGRREGFFQEDFSFLFEKKKKKIDGSFDRIDQASSKFQISVFIRIIYNNRSETKNNVIIIIDDRYYEKSRGKRSGGRRRRGGGEGN